MKALEEPQAQPARSWTPRSHAIEAAPEHGGGRLSARSRASLATALAFAERVHP